MFIGAIYELQEDRKKESLLGYRTIEIFERVLYHTRTITKTDDSEEEGEVYRRQVTHTTYEYLLYCAVDHKDTCEIMENDLSEEVMSGIYKYRNRRDGG